MSAHTTRMSYKILKSRKSEFRSNFPSGSVLWNYQDILSTFLRKISILDRRPCEVKHYFSFRGVRNVSFIFISHTESSGKNLSFIVFQTGWWDREAVLGRTPWVSLHLWPLSGQNEICRTWQHLGWKVICSVCPSFISHREFELAAVVCSHLRRHYYNQLVAQLYFVSFPRSLYTFRSPKLLRIKF